MSAVSQSIHHTHHTRHDEAEAERCIVEDSARLPPRVAEGQGKERWKHFMSHQRGLGFLMSEASAIWSDMSEAEKDTWSRQKVSIQQEAPAQRAPMAQDPLAVS